MTTSRRAVERHPGAAAPVARRRAQYVARTILVRILSTVVCAALSGCAAERYSFVRMSHQLDATGKYDPHARPELTDAVALNFADSVATLLRARFTGARITREVSSTLQVGLAAVAGAGSVFQLGPRTLAALGLGSAGIPELQGIFNARGRAEVYQDAIRLIEEAEIEYLAHNQRPSPDVLTQNGVTLLQRVTGSMHVVEKTLAGRLPSVQDMQQATERMTQKGALPTRAGAPAYNLNPENGPPSRVAEQEDRRLRTAAALDLPVRSVIRDTPPPPPLPVATDAPSTEAMRAAIEKVATQQGADAAIFTQAAQKFRDDTSDLPGNTAATRLLEAYKRSDVTTQKEIYRAVVAAAK
jgi:hypothetical protein